MNPEMKTTLNDPKTIREIYAEVLSGRGICLNLRETFEVQDSVHQFLATFMYKLGRESGSIDILRG